MFAKIIKMGLAAVALCSGGYGVAAYATPVTNWSYTLDSGFSAFSPSGVSGSRKNTLLAAPSLLTWGTNIGDGRSSLGVGSATKGHLTGNLVTGAAAQNTVQVVHKNREVTGTTLSTATLIDQLTLKATAPGSVAFTLPNLLFNIHFLETPNSGNCVVFSPVGNPCSDIFAIDVAAAGFSTIDSSLNQNFSYMGDNYNVKILLTGLGLLSNAACNAVGVSNGCIGFTTIENAVNTFQASLQISALPAKVPEPGTLVLLAIGLLGFGVAKSRRKHL